MKINASKVKQKLIKQALRVWKKYKGEKKYKIFYINAMIKLGWKYNDDGAYKEVLYKGSIVVKFNRLKKDERNEVLSEFNQYLYAKPELKRHLAKIYGLFDGLLIQEKVSKKALEGPKKQVKKLQNEAKKLVKRLKLSDWEQNYGVLRGIIKFHDIVQYKFVK